MSMWIRRLFIFFARAALVVALLYGALELAIELIFSPNPPSADFSEPANAAEAHHQDIAYFRHYLDLDRSYTAETRAIANGILADLEANLDNLSDAGFQLAIARAVAAADNGHSNIWLAKFSRAHGRIPLRFYWFSDGLYVVRAQPELSDLVGARLLAVNGVDVETAATLLRVFVGGTREAFRAYRGPGLFELPVAHHAAGMIDSESETRLSFQLPNGDVVTTSISAQALGEDANLYWPNRYLYESLPGDDEDNWIGIAGQVEAMPRYLQQPELPFQWLLLPEGGIYVQYRQNFGAGIEAFGDKVRTAIKEHKPRFVVIDQRFNGGGDYTLTEDLMSDLPHLLDDGAPIFIITGPATFSAGINSTAFARAAGKERVVLVGERIGDRERMYGETNDFVLPNSGLGMTFNTGLHDLENGCPPWPECYWRNYFNDIAVGKLDPDIVIETRFQDYLDGTDPVLETILGKYR